MDSGERQSHPDHSKRNATGQEEKFLLLIIVRSSYSLAADCHKSNVAVIKQYGHCLVRLTLNQFWRCQYIDTWNAALNKQWFRDSSFELSLFVLVLRHENKSRRTFRYHRCVTSLYDLVMWFIHHSSHEQVAMFPHSPETHRSLYNPGK